MKELLPYQEKELEQHRKELSENAERYIEEVKRDGFTNTHEYEARILARLSLVLISIIFFLVFAIVYLTIG